MPIEAWYLLVCGFAATLLVCAAILTYDYVRSRRSEDWRLQFQALQMENTRYLKKVHDENTRFFKSIGIKAEQIFERVDDPTWRDS